LIGFAAAAGSSSFFVHSGGGSSSLAVSFSGEPERADAEREREREGGKFTTWKKEETRFSFQHKKRGVEKKKEYQEISF
jgi:hypothetical protein